MQVNELRIGNLIKSIQLNGIVIVDLFLFGEINNDETYLDHLQGIPLTEEWLVKLGFTQTITPPEYWRSIEPRIECYCATPLEVRLTKQGFEIKIDFGLDERLFSEIQNSTTIKYVHTLQNLFFALTGNELTVKQ